MGFGVGGASVYTYMCLYPESFRPVDPKVGKLQTKPKNDRQRKLKNLSSPPPAADRIPVLSIHKDHVTRYHSPTRTKCITSTT